MKNLVENIDIVEIREILQNMLWLDLNRRWGFDQLLTATEQLEFEWDQDIEFSKLNPIKQAIYNQNFLNKNEEKKELNYKEEEIIKSNSGIFPKIIEEIFKEN